MRYRFGTLLLIAEQQLLLDSDTRVPLARKTFDILLLLLESAGEVVSRETLRQRVWEGAHVDEAVVSRNVSLVRIKLRPYFGDTEVIETISKRGYRLVVAVETIVAEPEDIALPGTDLEEQVPAADARSLPSAIVGGPQAAKTMSPLLRRALAGTTLVLLLLAIVTFSVYRSVRVHAQQDRLAVVDFRDLSGTPDDSWMGVALQESLTRELSRDRGITAIDGDQVALAQEDLGLSHARTFERAELDQMDKRLGAEYLVTGTYLPVGEQVRVDLVLHHGEQEISNFSDTVQQQDLQAAVGRAVAQMRGALHLPQAQKGGELEYFGRYPLAAHFYAEGLRLSRTGDTPRLAREAFSKAVQADPQFAEAHQALAVAWGLLGHDADSRAEAQLALDTCGSLPEKRRLSVQASAYRLVGNTGKALEALTRLRQLYPDDQTYKYRMASTLFSAYKFADATVLLREMEADKTHPPNLAVLQLLSTALTQQGVRSARFIYADKIMKLARAEGSRSAEARAHLFAGMGWMSALDGKKAVAEFNQGEKLSAEIGDKVGVITALMDETAARLQFHLPGALAVGQRGLDLAAEIGEDGAVASQCVNLAGAATDASQLRSAVSYARRALELSEQMNDPSVRLVATEDLAIFYLLQENISAAEKSAALELQYAHEMGNETDVATATEHQAEIDSYLGRWAAAEARFQEAAASKRHVGNPVGANAIMVECAWMLLQRGEAARAKEVLGSVDFGLLQDNEALAGYAQGRLALAAGDPARAESMVAKALAKDSVPSSTANGLDVLMESAVQQKDGAKAQSIAERYAALARAIPEDGAAQRGAIRAAAQAELLAGERSGDAVRKLPEILREASRLGHAAEVAELQRVLVQSRQ